MLKATKKRFDIKILVANSSVSDTFELDKNIVKVNGLLVTSDKDDLLYYRGTQKIEINKEGDGRLGDEKYQAAGSNRHH